VDLQTPAIKALERQRALTGSPTCFIFINPRTGQRFADSSRPLEVGHKALRGVKRGVNIRERGAKQTGTRTLRYGACRYESRLRLETKGLCERHD